MNLPVMFKASARELKNPHCLVTTGLLVAVFVVLKGYFSIRIGETLKISVAFIPLAAIGMLYGPVVGLIAGIPCDLLGALLQGVGILPVFTFIIMFNGLIYGVFLYGFELKKSVFQSVKLILAQAIVVFISHLVLNTAALYHYGFIGGDDSTIKAMVMIRVVKNLIEFPIDLVLLFILLPVIKMIYLKVFQGVGGERKSK